MKRMKKHKVKKEKPETSTSQTREKEDHDLAFYIHDRVELMHQVFSVLKYKELTAFAPECIRHISNNDLQELCTEELLGISSKRLCATLDSAAPPSDTESSSQSSPELETISLDSISSDEGLLSPVSGKKKKKHKHRTKGKSKRKSRSSDGGEGVEGQGSGEATRASRAGLTVLELLELQARARAIRAQLHQEQAAKHISETQPAEPSTHSDEHHSDVEIKEEPAEVVEISSEDEKPDIKELEKATEKPSSSQPSPEGPEKPEPVIKRVNDLIISVPQTKPTRKIKLNRHKVVISVPNVEKTNENVASPVRSVVVIDEKVPEVAKTKKKQKKKGKSKSDAKDGSDHDEITLQLSDSEKMDLLEDLDRKVYDSVSSSEDSESSSSDDDDTEKERQKQKLKEREKEKRTLKEKEKVREVNERENEKSKDEDQVEKVKEVPIEMDVAIDIDTVKDKSPEKEDVPKENTDITVLEEESNKVKETEIPNSETVNENIPITNAEEDIENRDKMEESREPNEVKNTEQTNCEAMETIDTGISEITEASVEKEMPMEISTIEEIPIIDDIPTAESSNKDNGTTEKEETDVGVSEIAINETEKDMERSEGEVSDKDSSEVEAVDLKPEVVCISDEESGKKKKKKKEKKKKEKKSKKTKSDFREGDDENFYRDTDECSIDDDVYEILELSDDSSCYEVEGTVLSKEPTAEEIAALSAKIDEIDREEVVTEEQIKHYENSASDQMETENISWKDRYLDSRKVKRVLSTANILNALRKKNKELKKKIEKSKEEVPVVIEEVVEKVTESLEEGSIEQYNTLQGSTKYVDPIAEVVVGEGNLESSMEEKEGPITKAMKKDAKQLLKMYKTLLKYNNINKEKDPNKKKKKKQKKKDKNKDSVNSSVAIAEVKNGV